MESGNLSCVGQCCVGADYLPSVAISRQLFLDHTPKPSPSLCLPPHQSRVSKTQYTKASKIPLEPNLWKTTPLNLHHYTGLGAWNSVILEYLPLGSSTTTLDRDSVYARTSTSICLANIKSSTTSCFPFLIELHFLLLDPDLPLYQNKHIPIETRHASPPRVQRQAQLGLYCTRIERFSSEWVSTIHFRLTSRST